MSAEKEERKRMMRDVYEKRVAKKEKEATETTLTVEKYKDFKGQGLTDIKIMERVGWHAVQLNKWKRENNLIRPKEKAPKSSVAVTPLKEETTALVHVEPDPVSEVAPAPVGQEIPEPFTVLPVDSPVEDVKKPAHYHKGGIDVIGFCKDKLSTERQAGFFQMNVLKYVTRYTEKGAPLKDLEKAKDYLDKLIELERDAK